MFDRLGRHGRLLAAIGLGLALVATPVLAEAKPAKPVRGLVAGTAFIDAFGDDAVTLEVTLPKSLLNVIVGADPELKTLAGGLESIYALILDLKDKAAVDKARGMVRDVEKKLVADGWERMARIRDEEAEIKVLVLVQNEDTIDGLVVMIVNAEDDEPNLVFANIAGPIDLAALEKLGDEVDLPGLKGLEFDH
jgi:hypothetical protein